MTEVSVHNIRILKFDGSRSVVSDDVLAVEEPLEIVLQQPSSTRSVSITMRTPGDDEHLAAGFLFTEGIIPDVKAIDSISISELNKVTVSLNCNSDTEKLNRHFYTTSSCGVCGKTSIDAILTIKSAPPINKMRIDPDVLLGLNEQLREQQKVFQSTGGLHASALFDADGNFEILKEDVGRHNALDKLVGHYLLSEQIPLTNKILLLSGRASFELIQKAVMAGITTVAAIGAPSSLAVELADRYGVTLIGFLKKNSFNVYTHPETIIK